MTIPRISLAATHSGSGKTTITAGIISALTNRGLTVQAFKTGPDYIDTGFHTLASGRPARNLDTVLTDKDAVLELFTRSAGDADIAVIEGVMGLYDGLSGSDEKGSTAHTAKLLGSPVVLCLDAGAMARSAAAVALGFLKFDPELNLAGFILNKIAGEHHLGLVKGPIEAATGLPVLGYFPGDKELAMPERHLGLTPAWEKGGLPESLVKAAKYAETHIDLDRLLAIAQAAPELPAVTPRIFTGRVFPEGQDKVRIAYAYDDAFHFYYEDNLDILKDLGAELVPFSPVHDARLPEHIGGLYFGGGYPELLAPQLEANKPMRSAVREAARKGLPVYAECGGLMYLMEKLKTFGGESYSMAGVFKGSVRMTDRLAALGYYKARAVADSVIAEKGWEIWGHVFHWSLLENLPDMYSPSLRLSAPERQDVSDGLAAGSVMAGYFHIHFAADLRWPARFVRKCSERFKSAAGSAG
ncbi:MAG: cobyrinate a,c-diamide synthase [Spirochaetales bacterium]|nr:MAG: cobyrinate a,c-diamide synthase [Spirochaetales bacterium]